jgi:hypothetical protein
MIFLPKKIDITKFPKLKSQSHPDKLSISLICELKRSTLSPSSGRRKPPHPLIFPLKPVVDERSDGPWNLRPMDAFFVARIR